jgi:hypothetical protein
MQQKHYFKMKAILSGLRNAVDALPTEAEKQEIESKCRHLVEFLSDLQKRVQSAPSDDQVASVKQAIQSLDEFFDRATHNPALASIVGLRPRPQTKPRLKQTTVTDEEKTAAKSMLAKLEKLPLDSMRAELENEAAYPTRQLQSMGTILGIRAFKGLSREGLIHQISTRIANYRGDRILRGETEQGAQGQ